MHQISPKSARDGEKKTGFPDSRGQIILTAIINEHFVTGEPVGSKVLADKFANATGMSSATIRNESGFQGCALVACVPFDRQLLRLGRQPLLIPPRVT